MERNILVSFLLMESSVYQVDRKLTTIKSIQHCATKEYKKTLIIWGSGKSIQDINTFWQIQFSPTTVYGNPKNITYCAKFWKHKNE